MLSGLRRRSVLVAAAVLLCGSTAQAAEGEALVARAMIAAPVSVPVMLSTAVAAAEIGVEPAQALTPPPFVQRPQQRKPVDSTVLRRSLYVSFAALQALDAHSTMKALRAGGHEANPFMQGIASNSAAMVAVKAGTAAATIFFAEKLAKKSPIGSLLVMAAFNSAYATVVAHNYRVAGR